MLSIRSWVLEKLSLWIYQTFKISKMNKNFSRKIVDGKVIVFDMSIVIHSSNFRPQFSSGRTQYAFWPWHFKALLLPSNIEEKKIKSGQRLQLVIKFLFFFMRIISHKNMRDIAKVIKWQCDATKKKNFTLFTI